jgi:mannose-6-phosphate isomerase-like protein (cupin superfamily)
MEVIRRESISTFRNSGVESEQLLFPENSASDRLTITRVTVLVGAISPRHIHARSEQVWVALEGTGTLLIAGDETIPIAAGDVVRFSDGEVHGFSNTGQAPFVYLSVTSPPVNFRGAYAKNW